MGRKGKCKNCNDSEKKKIRSPGVESGGREGGMDPMEQGIFRTMKLFCLAP